MTQDLVLAQVLVLSVLLTDSLTEQVLVPTAQMGLSLLLEPPPVPPVLLTAPPVMMDQHALHVTQELVSAPALAINVLPTLSQPVELVDVLIAPLLNSPSPEPPPALPALMGALIALTPALV